MSSVESRRVLWHPSGSLLYSWVYLRPTVGPEVTDEPPGQGEDSACLFRGGRVTVTPSVQQSGCGYRNKGGRTLK